MVVSPPQKCKAFLSYLCPVDFTVTKKKSLPLMGRHPTHPNSMPREAQCNAGLVVLFVSLLPLALIGWRVRRRCNKLILCGKCNSGNRFANTLDNNPFHFFKSLVMRSSSFLLYTKKKSFSLFFLLLASLKNIHLFRRR